MDNYGYEPDSEDEEEESGAKGDSVSDEPFILPDLGKNKINPYRYWIYNYVKMNNCFYLVIYQWWSSVCKASRWASVGKLLLL